jgi:hypothetical protein
MITSIAADSAIASGDAEAPAVKPMKGAKIMKAIARTGKTTEAIGVSVEYCFAIQASLPEKLESQSDFRWNAY